MKAIAAVARLVPLLFTTLIAGCQMPAEIEDLAVPVLTCNWQQAETHVTWEGDYCIVIEALDDSTSVSAHDDCRETSRCAVIGPNQMGYTYVDVARADLTPSVRVTADVCEIVLANIPEGDCDYSESF
jgi:hypothetical protein